MNKFWYTEALKDYKKYKISNPRLANKINTLLKDIEINGVANGLGKPERLKYIDAYNRRIDQANRLVYKLTSNNDLFIISCKGHYEDT